MKSLPRNGSEPEQDDPLDKKSATASVPPYFVSVLALRLTKKQLTLISVYAVASFLTAHMFSSMIFPLVYAGINLELPVILVLSLGRGYAFTAYNRYLDRKGRISGSR